MRLVPFVRFGGRREMESSDVNDDESFMPEYSSSSEWGESHSGPSVRRPRDFEYIPSTGVDATDSEVHGPSEISSAGVDNCGGLSEVPANSAIRQVAAAVAAKATSLEGVRDAMGEGVRQVGQLGGALRYTICGVPEVDPWRCLIGTMAIWGFAVVVARLTIA